MSTHSFNGPRLWDPHDEDGDPRASAQPEPGNKSGDQEELLRECSLIERTVFPARIADDVRALGKVPESADVKRGIVPDILALKDMRVGFHERYEALLAAARAQLGADFHRVCVVGTGNTFAYRTALDRAGVANMDDVDLLIQEIVDLEELVYQIREACGAVVPPSPPPPVKRGPRWPRGAA